MNRLKFNRKRFKTLALGIGSIECDIFIKDDRKLESNLLIEYLLKGCGYEG